LAWIERAAAGGSALAQADLASRYYEGRGVPRDMNLARHWALKAAPRGQRRAERVLCALDFHEHRLNEAQHWCLKGAAHGDAMAQFFLARLLKRGGTPTNEHRARHWMQQAAAQGLLAAQVRLGDYYHGGVGGQRDDRQALSWWLRAARAGNARAQLATARAYANGWGVKPDALVAYAWLSVANSQGVNNPALRHTLQRRLNAHQRVEAKRRAQALISH